MKKVKVTEPAVKLRGEPLEEPVLCCWHNRLKHALMGLNVSVTTLPRQVKLLDNFWNWLTLKSNMRHMKSASQREKFAYMQYPILWCIWRLCINLSTSHRSVESSLNTVHMLWSPSRVVVKLWQVMKVVDQDPGRWLDGRQQCVVDHITRIPTVSLQQVRELTP